MSEPRLLDRIQFAAARGLMALPRGVQNGLSGSRPIRIDGQELDPGIQLLVALRRLRGTPAMHAMPSGDLRDLMRRESIAFQGELAEVGGQRDLQVPGGVGPISARLYQPPAGAAPPPLMVYLHGGGMVFGDLDTHQAFCRLLCRVGEVAVLAIDYRLAPEHPFPAGLDDATAAFRWACAHAAELGADPSRVGVGGDSAGATLSAVIALYARRQGFAPPALQLLVYPATDFVNARPSQSLFSNGFLLTRADVVWFRDQYLAGGDPADHRISPLLAADLGGLAPALVVTSGFDPLRDEGEAYAEALRRAGTAVEARRWEGMVHGFVSMIGLSPAAHLASQEIARRAGELLRGSASEGT